MMEGGGGGGKGNCCDHMNEFVTYMNVLYIKLKLNISGLFNCINNEHSSNENTI